MSNVTPKTFNLQVVNQALPGNSKSSHDGTSPRASSRSFKITTVKDGEHLVTTSPRGKGAIKGDSTRRNSFSGGDGSAGKATDFDKSLMKKSKTLDNVRLLSSQDRSSNVEVKEELKVLDKRDILSADPDQTGKSNDQVKEKLNTLDVDEKLSEFAAQLNISEVKEVSSWQKELGDNLTIREADNFSGKIGDEVDQPVLGASNGSQATSLGELDRSFQNTFDKEGVRTKSPRGGEVRRRSCSLDSGNRELEKRGVEVRESKTLDKREIISDLGKLEKSGVEKKGAKPLVLGAVSLRQAAANVIDVEEIILEEIKAGCNLTIDGADSLRVFSVGNIGDEASLRISTYGACNCIETITIGNLGKKVKLDMGESKSLRKLCIGDIDAGNELIFPDSDILEELSLGAWQAGEEGDEISLSKKTARVELGNYRNLKKLHLGNIANLDKIPGYDNLRELTIRDVASSSCEVFLKFPRLEKFSSTNMGSQAMLIINKSPIGEFTITPSSSGSLNIFINGVSSGETIKLCLSKPSELKNIIIGTGSGKIASEPKKVKRSTDFGEAKSLELKRRLSSLFEPGDSAVIIVETLDARVIEFFEKEFFVNKRLCDAEGLVEILIWAVEKDFIGSSLVFYDYVQKLYLADPILAAKYYLGAAVRHDSEAIAGLVRVIALVKRKKVKIEDERQCWSFMEFYPRALKGLIEDLQKKVVLGEQSALIVLGKAKRDLREGRFVESAVGYLILAKNWTGTQNPKEELRALLQTLKSSDDEVARICGEDLELLFSETCGEDLKAVFLASSETITKKSGFFSTYFW